MRISWRAAQLLSMQNPGGHCVCINALQLCAAVLGPLTCRQVGLQLQAGPVPSMHARRQQEYPLYRSDTQCTALYAFTTTHSGTVTLYCSWHLMLS